MPHRQQRRAEEACLVAGVVLATCIFVSQWQLHLLFEQAADFRFLLALPRLRRHLDAQFSDALVLRELLQQRIGELGLVVRAEAGESEEEAATRTLIEQEVPLPLADEAACQQYYSGNQQRFFSAPLLAARHILLACPADDAEARSLAREQALQLIGQLQAAPQRFAELALQHSACPSKAQGGALGQISKGQTVPEFERQLFRLPVGLCQQPLESRYGYHLVFVDQRIEGEQLPYEVVAGSIRAELNQRVWQIGVSQYLQNLVGAANIEGILMQGAETPLMQ